jgi:uncharacterized protein (TIGR00255 family)
MVKSMTGYGGAEGSACGFDITVELKSVNNRFLDCNIRMPRTYMFAEEQMKGLIQKYISRGKVDVYVTLEQTGDAEAVVSVNENLAGAYIKALSGIAEKFGVGGNISATDVAKFPDVIRTEKAEQDNEAIAAAICSVLENALKAFNEMRSAEGAKLHEDIAARLTTIENHVSFVEERSPQTVQEYRERLRAKMAEVLASTTIDESRILTEAAIFADKIAVDEETVRLRSHIHQMRGFIDETSPVGRKMDFLIQEFNREANTIGSKASDTEIARAVVDIKAEIEKIREQIQNVE